MPPRLQLPSALRQCRAHTYGQRANVSTTPPAAALRNLRDPGSRVLGLDDSAPAARTSPTDALRNIYKDGDRHRRSAAARRDEIADSLRQRTVSDQFLRQMPRQWQVGDVYSPRDLGAAEMSKWKKPKRPKKDVIDMLGINPLDLYRNFSVISEFMTPLGQIKHSQFTGLRAVNQRKMARAIRRAVGMGLHPSVHKHPMLLLKDTRTVQTRSSKGN